MLNRYKPKLNSPGNFPFRPPVLNLSPIVISDRQTNEHECEISAKFDPNHGYHNCTCM
jgi:hypothetical protein